MMFIKKYLAFALMLFTMASNASGGYSAYISGFTSNGSIIFASKFNELLSLSAPKIGIAAKKLSNDGKSFRDVSYESQSNAKYIIFALLFVALFFAVVYTNSAMVKNSIWKLAVF